MKGKESEVSGDDAVQVVSGKSYSMGKVQTPPYEKAVKGKGVEHVTQ